MKFRNLALFLLLGAGLNLSAAPIQISTSGTFSSATPSTAWTSADGNWSLSFTLDNDPAVSGTLPGAGFNAAVSSFVYTLNGDAVDVGPVDVLFYNQADSGLFSVGLLGDLAGPFQSQGFQFEGPQIYSGAELNPKILAGTYTAPSNTLLVDGNTYDLGGLTISANLITPTPEPAAFCLMALSMVAISMRHLFNRKRSVA